MGEHEKYGLAADDETVLSVIAFLQTARDSRVYHRV